MRLARVRRHTKADVVKPSSKYVPSRMIEAVGSTRVPEGNTFVYRGYAKESMELRGPTRIA